MFFYMLDLAPRGPRLPVSNIYCPNFLGNHFHCVHLKSDLYPGYLQVVKTSAVSDAFRGTPSPTGGPRRSCSATTGCGTPSRIASLSANHLVRTEVAVSRTTSACAER